MTIAPEMTKLQKLGVYVMADIIQKKGESYSPSEVAKEASEWIEKAIQEMRDSPEANPWKRMSDEDIATFVVLVIETKRSMRSDDQPPRL